MPPTGVHRRESVRSKLGLRRGDRSSAFLTPRTRRSIGVIFAAALRVLAACEGAASTDRSNRHSIMCRCTLSLLLVGFLIASVEGAAACGNGKRILEDKFATLDPAWDFKNSDPTAAFSPTSRWKLPLLPTLISMPAVSCRSKREPRVSPRAIVGQIVIRSSSRRSALCLPLRPLW